MGKKEQFFRLPIFEKNWGKKRYFLDQIFYLKSKKNVDLLTVFHMDYDKEFHFLGFFGFVNFAIFCVAFINAISQFLYQDPIISFSFFDYKLFLIFWFLSNEAIRSIMSENMSEMGPRSMIMSIFFVPKTDVFSYRFLKKTEVKNAIFRRSKMPFFGGRKCHFLELIFAPKSKKIKILYTNSI